MAFNPSKYKQTSADGVWADWQGGRFLIAKSGTAKHVKIQERVFKPYKHQLNLPSFDSELRKDLMAQVAAEAILVGWDESIVDDNDKPIEYSVERAAQMLLDIPELTEFVTNFSLNHINYRAETVAETAKKSDELSSGAPTGAEKKEKQS